MCDFMQALIPPVPGTIPAHRFVTSVLHTFPVTATVSTRSAQVGDTSVKCDFMQALIRPSPGCMPAHSVLISPAHGLPACVATATEPDSSRAVDITSPDRITAILGSSVRFKKGG